jgi:hypothetical protein|nr:MAG TPA: hypothetical protein [Caudoviricetes sp.]
MNITLNLLGKPSNPSKFLFVWWNDKSGECYCECIPEKDYATAEYVVLQILSKTGINNGVLYKSAVKPNDKNKQHVFRVYAPFAIYSGDKYKLTKLKKWEDSSHAPIEIWRNEIANWHADFIKFSALEWDEMRKAIYTNFDRVYGRIVK